jgi:PAS domain S-box-containing protein
VVIGYVGGNLDITERRAATTDLAASEQRFRTLAATLPVGIYETDTAGQCTFTNVAWQRMANLTAAESTGHGWASTIHPEDRQNVFDAWNQAILQGLTFEHEFRFQHHDDTTCWVHSIASAVTQNGAIIGFVGVNEDITERRRSIETLSASLAEKEVLLREVHHRVKNNLQLVTSLLSLQAAYISDPIALELFQESQRRVRTMALVHEMLYAHTSLARIQIDVYLRQLAQTIVRSFSREKERTHDELEIAPLALVPDITIPLGLIVNELITNSCKHAVVAGQNLVFSLQIKKTAPHQAALTFTDNGPGVPPDFDPIKAKSLGHRLIGLLSRQLRAELDPPTPGGPATYVIRFKFENLPNRPETASLRPSTKLP